jgi:hypothetical protein
VQRGGAIGFGGIGIRLPGKERSHGVDLSILDRFDDGRGTGADGHDRHHEHTKRCDEDSESTL